MANTSRELRGRPVTVDEARESVRRLINSHFHNKDSARCSIPAQASDDDLVASDYVTESAERIAQLERYLAVANQRIAVLTAPVTDEEWGTCDVPAFTQIDAMHRKLANTIISNRAATAAEEPQP